MTDAHGELEKLAAQGLFRSRKVVEGPQDVEVHVGGHRLVNFCSNNYLGLANHPKVREAFKKGVDLYGVGTGASHMISGHTVAHHRLEEQLANLTGRKRALLFSTGYMANLGVVSALVDRKGRVLEDRLNHASLIDGGLLSRAKFQRYAHGDVLDLERMLSSSSDPAMVVTDGVFSMDGDLAPLADIAGLSRQYQACLMVDDAHGFGVLGRNGGGISEYFNLDSGQIPILMATLGKAIGTFGAFVVGDEDLIEFLLQKTRTYIYTTAMPAAVACATSQSLDLLDEEGWRRDQLKELIRQFRQGALQLGIKLMASDTPIQPLLIGDSGRAVDVAEQLFKQGFWVGAIRPPTVPLGSARLRITLTADHCPGHIDQLLDALSGVLS